MKTIKLTQGQSTIVDDEDFEKFGHLNWHAQYDKVGKRFYAKRNIYIGGLPSNPKYKSFRLHRVIMGIDDPKVLVDHRNHDGLDNQRSNLRIATSSQNQSNRVGAASHSKSGVRGVHWHKRELKWRAVIVVNGNKIYLGSFTHKNDAADAYKNANRKHFGYFGGKS